MDDENNHMEVKFTNGDRYIGKFKNEQFHGEGEYYFSNGNSYKGNFNLGVFSGKGIFYDNANGITIEAEFRNNEPINPVRLTNSTEGFEYYGDIKDGEREGKGIFKFPKQYGTNSPSLYEGDFHNNKFSGKGKLHWDQGGVYEGEFEEGEMNGRGVYTDDDMRYEGEFLNGKKHGKGVLVYRRTGEIYEGAFKHDKKEGQGKYQYKDKSVYSGMFVDDKKHGKGELVLADGTKYVGTFRDGVFHGKGLLNMNGATFEGDFKENVAEGEGIVEFSNGNKLIANYKENMKMGPATLYIDDRGKTKQYTGEFSYNVEKADKANFGTRY